MTHKEWVRLTTDLKSGKEPMARAGMLAVIEDLGLEGGPDMGVNGWMELYQEWTRAAKADWIDVLLQVVADPPPEDVRCWSWDSTTPCFLDALVQKFPAHAFATITALLPTENDALRPYLITRLGSTGLPEAQAWLQPFVDSIESLPLA